MVTIFQLHDFQLSYQLSKMANCCIVTDHNRIDMLQFLLLNQVVQILSPWKDSLHAPESFLSKAKELNGTNAQSFPLLPALKKGLGGPEYVLTGVYTKYGHFIGKKMCIYIDTCRYLVFYSIFKIIDIIII